MTQTTNPRQSSIPRSEAQLVRAIDNGDVIRIAYLGSDSYNSKWTVYAGEKNGRDRYLFQKKAGHEGDADLVEIHEAERRTNQYDSDLGVILNSLYERTNFVGPVIPSHREEYEELSSKLKEAGLWH